jgi:hypothetical protein
MRTGKIRGQRRRHKSIERWRSESLILRTDLLEKYSRDNSDIVVHPWCDISIINSVIPHPKGTTKQLMLSALLDIYESWKAQLNNLSQPYYLKIWIFETHFSKSQVVCAVGGQIEYYENIFYTPDLQKKFNPDNYGKLNHRLQKLNWSFRSHENYYFNNEVGQPEQYATYKDYEETKHWFAALLKKPHRSGKLQEPTGDATEYYAFKQGDVWIGGE